MVEQGRADEVAALEVRIAELQVIAGAFAAVDDGLGAGLHTLIDVVVHPLQCSLGDQRTVVGLRVQAVAHPQVVDPFNQPGAQPIRGLLADRAPRR